MNSFILSLDTIAPKLKLQGISYTVAGIPYKVTVISNEKLSAYQKVYFKDATGKIINIPVNFSNDGMSVEGITELSNAEPGIGKIYAELADEVGNIAKTEMAVNVFANKFYCCHVYSYTAQIKTVLIGPRLPGLNIKAGNVTVLGTNSNIKLKNSQTKAMLSAKTIRTEVNVCDCVKRKHS